MYLEFLRSREVPWEKFIATLKDMKYDNVVKGVTDMSLYGIPQKAPFHFTGFPRFENLYAGIDRQNKDRERCSRFGKRLSENRSRSERQNEVLHTSAGLSPKNLERLRMTRKDGGDRSDWQNKKAYRLPCYVSDEKKFPDNYGRMWWDKPAPTITTKFFSVSNGRFAHPEENRGLSLREGATLQTFPKDYEFIGTGIGPVAR